MANKRIRKKKSLGEFAILAFRVFADSFTAASIDDIFNAFDEKAYMVSGGIVNGKLDLLVWICDGCGDHKFRQTNKEDQEWVKNWLTERGATNLRMGSLLDIGHKKNWV